MTRRPPHDPAVEDNAATAPAAEDHSGVDAGSAGGVAEVSAAAPRPGSGATGDEPSKAAAPTRPGPRPSPTSRARRAAAAPEGLRRPSPRPTPAAATTASAAEPAAATTASAAEPAAATTASAAEPATATTTSTAEPAADSAAGSLDAQPAELVSRQPSDAERGRRAPAWLVAVLTVLALALAGLDGWLLTSQPTSGSRAERDHALSTAKSAVPLILSYNHQRFDADVAAAKARLTGRAVTDYVQAMTKTIKPTATKVQAIVQAQTNGAGVEAVSDDGDQVTVVVFGEQKVTNTALKTPRLDLFRVRVTLDRVQGQWLVSKFDQI